MNWSGDELEKCLDLNQQSRSLTRFGEQMFYDCLRLIMEEAIQHYDDFDEFSNYWGE